MLLVGCHQRQPKFSDADALEESFAQFEDEDDGAAALKVELETLKAKIASGVIAAQRPALDGVKSAESSSFIDQYVRRGIEASLETKAVAGSSVLMRARISRRMVDCRINVDQ